SLVVRAPVPGATIESLPVDDATGADVYVAVVDVNGNPCADCTVRASCPGQTRREAVSDGFGQVQFLGLAPGILRMDASGRHRVRANSEWVLTSGRNQRVEIRFRARNWELAKESLVHRKCLHTM